MVIVADVVLLPAASVATTWSVWVPSATLLLIFHEMEYGDDLSIASCLVPSKKVTDAMPEGAPDPVPRSVALADTVTIVPRWSVNPLTGLVIDTVGAAASMRTVRLEAELWLPAPSTAIALIVVVWEIGNGPV
jgi:hypothetical protein